jgi:hypothetical protein
MEVQVLSWILTNMKSICPICGRPKEGLGNGKSVCWTSGCIVYENSPEFKLMNKLFGRRKRTWTKFNF